MDSTLKFLNNEYVTIILALLLTLYAIALSRIELPDYIRNLFSNNIFRIVWLSLLLVNFNRSPHVAIAIALVFVLTMQYLNDRETHENVIYLHAYQEEKSKNL